MQTPLTNFFSEIGPNLSDKLPNSNYAPESYVKCINDDFHFRTITESEVLKLLSTLKTSKATGHDKISPKLLKDSADIITKSLTQIFNKSILVGKFPDDLKIAIISPIYKRTTDQFRCFPSSQKSLKQLFPSSFQIIWK